MTNGQDNVSWLLLRVSVRAKHGLIKLAEGYTLTAMQALTVCLLEPEKSVPMHSISKMLSCDASNVTGIVDKLVAQSYIERKESNTDRRVNTITLTQKGATVRTELLGKITEEYLPQMADFSQEELATFKSFLVKILADSSSVT
jgi:DNA-binding MarR family transcriptional regulator